MQGANGPIVAKCVFCLSGCWGTQFEHSFTCCKHCMGGSQHGPCSGIGHSICVTLVSALNPNSYKPERANAERRPVLLKSRRLNPVSRPRIHQASSLDVGAGASVVVFLVQPLQ